MSPRTRLILAIAAPLLVCLIFYFVAIRGQQSELGTVRTDIDAANSQTLTLQAQLAQLRDLQARAPQLEAQLQEIRQLVPTDDQVPNFIYLLQNAADQSGVTLTQIQPELPRQPPEGAPLAQVRAQIGASGGYFAVQDFMRRLYDLDRAVRIDNITLASAEGAAAGAATEINLTMATRIFFEIPGAGGAATAPEGGAPVTPAPTTSP